jgi:anti-sigma factor-like protein
MKAVVVEIRDKYVAVLSNDGRIYKIKNDDYNIGQEIEIKKYLVNNNRFIKTIATVAASIMLLVVPAWAYLTPYSYVSLDVNPSLEYTVNIFDRVLRVEAVNDDGEMILKEMNLDELKNKNIEVAVQEVVNDIIEAGFLEKSEEGGIVIATSSKNDEKSQELADKLKLQVEEKIKEEFIESKVEVEAIGVGEERVQEAKELGVTPGKLNLVEKLQESSENPDDIIIEDWLKKPVKEIVKATKQNKKEEKAVNKEIENGLEDNETEEVYDKKNVESKELDKEIKKEEKVESKEENILDKETNKEEKLIDKEDKKEEKEEKEEKSTGNGNNKEDKSKGKEVKNKDH